MKARILVVDDAPQNIQILSATLREAGYQVLAATNGKQALEALRKVRPDLILLDVMMPEMDGIEACQRLKANPDWRDIPVIFLTAKTATEDIVKGFESGAVDYVGKPFNAHELLARVATHLALDRLNRENERLLRNVLPARIAELLKHEGGVIAERFEDVSVLFADIVEFTPLSARLTPTALVELLNRIFTAFDDLVERRGLEKIKTIGDAYMVAGGLPDPRPDHLEAMAHLALEMLAKVEELGGLKVRIGLHVGSAVAGVIGSRKFSYDVWGDTVNTASRLESHGVPGRVHVSEAVRERLEPKGFSLERRGTIELKGRGPMTTYYLNVS